MNIKYYLPSKKIIIAISITLIIATLYFIYFFVFVGGNNKEVDNFIDVSPVSQKNADSFYYIDTDNDGAYDWEEALWPELDPNNPDSDGDGVLDGKYIKNKKAIQEKERRGTSNIESNLTETEKLGRSTLTALVAVIQSGDNFDEESKAKFSENVAEYIGDLTLGNILYTRDQFDLVADNQTNIYKYRDHMKILLTEYPVATSDIELLINAIKSPDENIESVADASIKYNEYLTELTSLEVPYAIAGRHTELANSISQLTASFDNLLLLDEADELVSLAALVQMESIMDKIATALIKISEFFDIVDKPGIFKDIYEQ